MSTIDNRVVKMEFDNSGFQSNTQDTIAALGSLDDSINTLTNSNLSSISSSLSNISSKFSLFGVAGVTAIGNLVSSAVDAGKSMASALISPIVEGGKKRALNIEQAKFQFEGLGIDVTAAMESANEAVLGTAYGLDEAARLASIFGASGMQAGDEMTTALKAVAGVAAMSGSSFSDVGDIFSDVAGKGVAMTEDFNRLAARSVNGFAVLGKYLGKTETEVRKMASQGEISFEIFSAAMSDAFGEHATKANETYTGSLSNMRSALARIGALFSAGENAISGDATGSFERMRIIFNALTPKINQVKDAIIPFAAAWNTIKMEKANNLADFLNNLDLTPLTNIGKFFGQTLLNMDAAVKSYLTPIKSAFNSVFGGSGGGIWKALTNAAEAIARFTAGLKASEKTAKTVETVFTKFFTALKNFGATIQFVKGKISELLESLIPLGKAFLKYIQPVRDFIAALDFSSISGGKASLNDILEKIKEIGGSALSTAIATIKNFIDILTDYFNGVDINLGERIVKALEPIKDAFERAKDAVGDFFSNLSVKADSGEGRLAQFKGFIEGVINVLKGVKDQMSVVADAGTSFFSSMIGFWTKFFDNLDITQILALLQSGSLLTIALTFKKAIDTLATPFDAITQIANSVSGTLDQLTASLKTMQQDVKAGVVLKIAVAVGILALSVALLSQINTGDLLKATVTIGAMMAMLSATLYALVKIADGKDVAKLPRLSVSLTILAIALRILADAIIKLSALSWEELAKGLVGVAAGLAIMIGALYLLSSDKISDDLIKSSVSMVIMAAAMWVMAEAVEKFGEMDYETLKQGMLGFVATLAAVSIALALISENGAKTLAAAIALGIMSLAMMQFYLVIAAMSLIPWGVFMDGFAKFAILLGTLTIAIMLMSSNAAGLSAAALALAAMTVAIGAMVAAIFVLGSMDIATLVQGIAALAVVLGVLVIATNSMTSAIPGAAALIFVAGAILILAYAIKFVGEMPFENIKNGLIGIGGALAILLVAGMFAQTVAVGLGVLALVFAAIGVAAIAVAAAMVLTTIALAAFGPAAAIASAGLRVLSQAAIQNKAAIGPLIGLGVGLGVLGVALMAVGAGAILTGAGLVAMGVGMLLFGVNAPAGILALQTMVDTFGLMDMAKMVALAAALAPLGAALLVLGVGALAAGVGLAAAALALGLFSIASLAFSATSNRLINAFEKLSPYVSVITALATSLMLLATSTSSSANTLNSLTSAISNLGVGLAIFAVKVLLAITALNTFATAVSSSRSKITSTFTSINTSISKAMDSIVKAIQNGSTSAAKALTTFATAVKTGMTMIVKLITDTQPKVESEVKSMTKSLGTTASSQILASAPALSSASLSVGSAIINGMTSGLYNGSYKVSSAARTVAQRALNSAKNTLGVASPSKEFEWIGEMGDEGLAGGFYKNSSLVEKAASSVASDSLKAAGDAFTAISDYIPDDLDFDPVITPVIDLSDAEEKSGILSSLFSSITAPVKTSTDLASQASTSMANRATTALAEAPSSTTSFEYNQYNTSPKALSRSEIYRQTKNQLSTVKGALGK